MGHHVVAGCGLDGLLRDRMLEEAAACAPQSWRTVRRSSTPGVGPRDASPWPLALHSHALRAALADANADVRVFAQLAIGRIEGR